MADSFSFQALKPPGVQLPFMTGLFIGLGAALTAAWMLDDNVPSKLIKWDYTPSPVFVLE